MLMELAPYVNAMRITQYIVIVRSIKGFYVMAAYELIKFDEEGRAVRDCTSAKRG